MRHLFLASTIVVFAPFAYPIAPSLGHFPWEAKWTGAQQQAAARPQESQEAAILSSARRARLAGRHSEAARQYAQFIADNPKSSRLFEARFWYAKSLFAEQKWDEAAEAFTDFLSRHSDQRTYSRQAKEDRIHSWRVRQRRNPKAVPSLKAALNDADEDIRILAALALAENKDASGRQVLEQGLNHAKFSEQCGLALWRLGIRKQPSQNDAGAARVRMLVVRIKADNPEDSFEMKVPLSFFKNMEEMLPAIASFLEAETRAEMAEKGVGNFADLAASAPKGQILFQFKSGDGKTNIIISVD
jgi:tetratricopeptide (TPR) repeat protein